MAKSRRTVDHVVDAAREVTGWLDLLGRNCCTGRSYRGMDNAKRLAGSDEAPSMLSLAIAVPFTVFGLALLIELGFRRGTIGPNPNGPDPLAKT